MMRGRFDSLGGNADLLHVVRGLKIVYSDDNVEECSLTLSDISLLEEAVHEYKPALLVIDPLQSYLGAGVDAHRANETRPILDGLIRLTEKHRLATLILRHLSKMIGGKALYRGQGSIDFTAAARSQLLAGQLPDNPDDRAMVHVKPFTVTGQSLGYRILKEGPWGRFGWTGPTNITANDLLCAPSPPSKLDEATDFLKVVLGNGSVTQPQVLIKAEEQGISEKTLRRAKKKLQIQSTRKSYQGHVLWEFPKPEKESSGEEEVPDSGPVN